MCDCVRDLAPSAGKFISVYSQLPRSTQPGHPSVGRCIENQPKGGDTLRLGRRHITCQKGRLTLSLLPILLLVTVKPSMLACPLFREFREPNKTAKLKGANINCRQKYGEITTVFRIVWFQFTEIKGAKIILRAKSPTFWAAKLKGFTVGQKFVIILYILWTQVNRPIQTGRRSAVRCTQTMER